MTAQALSSPTDFPFEHDPLAGPHALESARRHVAEGALTESPGGRVGLELELHLVDLAEPARRPEWREVLAAAAAALPAMPSGSSVTLEPGGQIELSTPPSADLVSSVAALRADRVVLRDGLARLGLGAAPLGTDPARPVRRVNPNGRYVAMEQHFTALGCAEPGKAMMSATAALQVNLDAGPATGWVDRLHLIHSLGPVLVAASAASPLLGGTASGWHSMRQEIWHGIDHSRSEPVVGVDPAEAWAHYALSAPVMLVRDGTVVTPVTRRVPFGAWLQGAGPVDRPPTVDDLDYHLTTLFPPVRPRGYLEIRCIDAMPDRWWPAVAALATILIDDPVAADRAAELAAPVADAWSVAARQGLGDQAVRTAVQGCVAVALDRCPPALKPELEAYATLIDAGRTPSDELRDRAAAVGPLGLLEEVARESA